MEKKTKGLVDDHEHGIILNESGTSVSYDPGEGTSAEDEETNLPKEDAKAGPEKSEPGTDDQK